MNYDLVPLREGLAIVLRLLRSSGRPELILAKAGLYQQMLGGTQSQMVRVCLAEDERSVPEISANKYALNIRFGAVDAGAQKPRICDRDVKFELTFCNL